MKIRAFLYIIIAGVLWGTSCLFVNALAPYGLSGLQMVCIRGTGAAAAMCIFMFFYDRRMFKVSKKELLLYFCSGAAMYLTAAFYYVAILKASPSVAVMLMYTAPVMVMIYSVAFMGEKFNIPKGISVVLMVLGCALVSGIVGGAEFSLLGAFLGFLSGVCYSAYNIFTKTQMNRKCNPLAASLYCYIFMGLCSLVLSVPGQIIEVAINNPDSIPYILLCGICTCVLPYFLYTLALKVLPAGTATALGVTEPLATTLLSVIFLNEVLGVYSILGIILIVTAVFLLSRTNE